MEWGTGSGPTNPYPTCMSMAEPMEESEDARWDPIFRRQLRQVYRDQLSDTQSNRDDITLPDELVKRVKRIDTLFQDVVAPREAAIDSEGIRVLSAIGREQVESTQGDILHFDPTIYAEKLVTFMGGRRGGDEVSLDLLDWERLGERASLAIWKVPSPTFLFGALDVEPLRRHHRERRAQDRAGQSVDRRPKEVSRFEEQEESTTKDVGHVLGCLKVACEEGGGRIHYFTFVVDPDSFAHTVENMFHLSFLIKEGRAGMMVAEEDGQPYVYLPSQVNDRGVSTQQTKNQAILSMTMPHWRRAIEKFHITKSYIPHREQ